MKLKTINSKLKLIMMSLSTLLCFSFSSFAQNITATAKMDSSAIKIGQQAKIKLTVRYRADRNSYIKIKWPEISDTLRKEIEVIGQSRIDTLIPDKKNIYEFEQTRTITVTSFDSGYWAIPPFKFEVNDDTNAILTDPLLLEVNTVQVDTTMAIKDIKAPFGQKYSWIDWLKDHMYVVYGGLAILALVIALIFFIRRYRKNKPAPVIPQAPKIPAHIIAYEKLEKLKSDKLWQDGKYKQYYSGLTDILREYIENRFKIQALEQTTDEILLGLRNAAIDDESKLKLKQVLKLADLVKFAKEQPLPAENEMSMSNSYGFIDGTRREDENDNNKQLIANATE